MSVVKVSVCCEAYVDTVEVNPKKIVNSAITDKSVYYICQNCKKPCDIFDKEI